MELFIKSAPADTKLPCRTQPIIGMLPEGFHNGRGFRLSLGAAEGRAWRQTFARNAMGRAWKRRGSSQAERLRQVADADIAVGTERDGSFDDITQLADISRPAMGFEEP